MTDFVRPEIAAMQGYVPGEQPPPGKFIKLNTNENPYPPSQAAVRAIVEVAEHALARYPDPLGTAFRMRAADVLGVPPDWILCGNGSDDILTIVTRALVGQGDLLRLPYPSYILYRTLAELQGARFEQVHFASRLATDTRLHARRTPRLRLVFLPNPNSPSGTVVPPDQVLEVAAAVAMSVAGGRGICRFCRDELCGAGREVSQDHGRADAQQVVLAGGTAVRFPGGPAVTDRGVGQGQGFVQLRCAGDRRSHGRHGGPGLADGKLAVGFLPRASGWSRRCGHWGLPSCPSQANFVWCTHSERPLQPVYEKLKASHVLVRYMNYPEWGEGLRISVGTDEQIDACVDLLKAILQHGTHGNH